MAKKILVIEDDLDFYNLCKTQLSLKGYEVSNVATGDRAIDTIKEQNPDLIILDVLLPGRNGLEILEELKNTDTLKDLKVIMLTNFGNEDNVSRALDLGAEDYLMKYNVVPEEISDKVASILGDNSDSSVKIMS